MPWGNALHDENTSKRTTRTYQNAGRPRPELSLRCDRQGPKGGSSSAGDEVKSFLHKMFWCRGGARKCGNPRAVMRGRVSGPGAAAAAQRLARGPPRLPKVAAPLWRGGRRWRGDRDGSCVLTLGSRRGARRWRGDRVARVRPQGGREGGRARLRASLDA